MKKLFEKQLSGNLPLTKEILERPKNKTFNDTYNGQNSELCKLLFDDLIEPKKTKTDNEILDFWGRTLGLLNGVDDKLKIKMAYSFEEAAHILLTYQLGSDRFNEYIFPLIRKIITLDENSYNINKLLQFCREYVPVIDGKCFSPITSQLQCSEFYENEVLILELMAKKYVELNKK